MTRDKIIALAEELNKNREIRKKFTESYVLIHCKDCKYFEWDHWENVNGIPLIVSHEICNKWGDGCKTSVDGYCFLAERREE